jgi:micrococcal nuclease
LKKFSALLFLILVLDLFLVGFPGLTLSAETVRVTGVIDGDTIIIADGHRIRYLGIDTPEKVKDGPDEFLAREAYEFNRKLVLNKEVQLRYGSEQRDSFGRVLAYVFLGNGVLVNGELVKQGLARVLYHGPWMERFGELLQHQREAIRDRKGIWVKALGESDDSYRGQIHTRRFHRPDCSLGEKIAPKNLIIFRSKKEAYWQGYSPCRTCKP